jgi:hypothetical protein
MPDFRRGKTVNVDREFLLDCGEEVNIIGEVEFRVEPALDKDLCVFPRD